jgi:GNAT superfamily N-acetyltransferase
MGMTGIEPQVVSVRRVTPEDAAAVAELCCQLGYAATVEEARDRITSLAALRASQAVFVACVGLEVVGWIDVALPFHLQTAPFALIGGLVVKDGLRGLRIGKRLCEEAEMWSRAQGVAVVRVTSRSSREAAHRFYRREGYAEVKLSRVFEKKL